MWRNLSRRNFIQLFDYWNKFQTHLRLKRTLFITTQHNTTQHNTTDRTTQHDTTQHDTTQHDTTQSQMWDLKQVKSDVSSKNKTNKKPITKNNFFLYVSIHIVNLTPPAPTSRRSIRYTHRITGMYMYTNTSILPKMSWTGTLILHRHRNDCIETPAYFLCNVSFTHTFTPPTALQAIHSDITVPVDWA